MPADVAPPRGAVLITGASAGLGAELARAYAGPGRVLGLLARRAGPLTEIVADCRARGSQVVTGHLDVTDATALTRWITAFDRQHPIGLAFVNAGVFGGIGADGELETAAETQLMLRTNLEAAILTAGSVAEGMRRRRSGRIVLIASLAARQPLADAPVYSASKAGLAAYGEALRERLEPEGIGVTIVLPGHFATSQTAAQSGRLPQLMSAAEAARRIQRDLDRDRSQIVFPASLAWLIRAGRLLPWQWRARAGRPFRFTVRDPE